MCNFIEYNQIEKYPFKDTNTSIAYTPSLSSLYLEKEFILYTFSSDNSLATVLTQKGELGDEYPISFMRTGLQGAELNYPTVDKQTYAVFKVAKQFRLYILKNITKVVVPHPTVRYIFVQKELGEQRGN